MVTVSYSRKLLSFWGDEKKKGEERFILEQKQLFLALCRLSLVGKKVQHSPVPESNTCFWDGFLP